jgi:GxxExxY protein
LNRRGAEAPREDQITERVIGCAIEVHRVLGPGLLESAYEECLCHELSLAGMSFCRQVAVPVQYKAVSLDCGYVLDLMIEDLVIVELKTVEKLLPIHEAQLLTYLRLLNKPVGLLLNFRESLLKSGLKRIVNNFSDSSASLRLGGSIAK